MRNSTESQDYQFQLDKLLEHLNKFNDVELIKVYKEKVSGFRSEEEREQMNLLLQSVEKNEIDEIWLYSLNRLSRSSIHLQVIVEKCFKSKVNIYFYQQGYSSLNSAGEYTDMMKLLISIMSNFAESDAKSFGKKSRDGKKSKTETHNYVGGMLPIGYDYDNDFLNKTKKIKVHEDRKLLVEYIFDQYVNKKQSIVSITNDLNIKKEIDFNFQPSFKYSGKIMVNVKGDQWSPSTIKRVLENTWYIGTRFYLGKQIILNESLRIIPLDVFDKAQKILKTNKHRGTERTHNYLIKD